jgi:hypothetical protein
MKKFNNKYRLILTEMEAGDVFGAGQAHPVDARSGDFYATGDARNLWGSGSALRKGKKKKKKFKLIRRNLRNSL